MGIDLIRGGRIANRGFRTTKSGNSYLKSLIHVTLISCSSTPSYQEELTPNSTKSSINVSINPDSIVTPSPSHALLSISPMIAHLPPKVITNSSALSPLLEPSPTMLDYSTYPKDSELSPLDSPKLPEIESQLPREAAWLSTNSHNSPPLEKTSCCLEVQETEKPKDISVFAPAKKAHTLLLVLDQLVENSKWPEEEDDSFVFNISNNSMKH